MKRSVAALVLSSLAAWALPSAPAHAGSVAYESISLERAATFANRIVVGKVIARSSFHFPGSAEYQAQAKGKALGYIQIKVAKTLKGPAFAVGDELRIFSAGEWFAHTHAAVIEGGVVSYADPHYTGKLRGGSIKEGSDVIFFLGDEPAPAGFPRGAFFLAFGEAYDRADREGEVAAAVKDGPFVEFDHIVVLRKEQKVRFPDRLELEFVGQSHKRPVTGGPQRETAEVRVAKGGKSEMIGLGHVTKPDGRETWATETWGGYSFEIRGMSDVQATVVVRKKSP